MSGIAGIYYPDGRLVDQTLLNRMVDILAHRGPDGADVWCDGSVGLSHRMLWTTPESLIEKLPLEKRNSGLVITSDARIDNRDELIASLNLGGRNPAEITDTDLILATYEKWGEQCAEKLLGDFAFVIWDGRRQQLFCARDPIGIKPFYYYHAAGTFYFASEIKAILCLKKIPSRLNELKVADYLVPIFNDQNSTFYKDIFRLPPAHSMVVGYKGLRVWSYWMLDLSRELRLNSDEEYVEAFRELFKDAVRCRLRSAFPVGSTLSGGLDSSSIACTAEKLLSEDRRQSLHTYSAIFPSVVKEDPRIDERPFIEAVLAMGNFEPHYVRADCCKPLADVTWHKDEAWAAPSLYMGRAIFRKAHEHGVRVLLSGFDGDVVISYGYEYLKELARTGRWTDFAKEVNYIVQLRPQINAIYYLRRYGIGYLTKLFHKLRWWTFAKQVGEVSDLFDLSCLYVFLYAALKPFVPHLMRRAWHVLNGNTQSRLSVWGLNSAINSVFARRIGLAKRIQNFNMPELKCANPLRNQHLLTLMDGRLEYVANIFDQTAATFALEQRYPFFDRRLMEFCVALPFQQKLWKGWSRAILRRAMENILPPKVQWRIDKGNLSLNIRRRLLKERETLDQVIFHDHRIIEKFVDVTALRSAYRNFVSTKPSLISEEDLFTIFLSVNLALWMRQSGMSHINI